MRKNQTTKPAKAELPGIRLDVHPHVVIAHQGNDATPLFQHQTSTGTQSVKDQVALYKAGFSDRKVDVQFFTEQGIIATGNDGKPLKE